MTKRKQVQAPTGAEMLARAKAIVLDERATPALREQAVQLAYDLGVSDGRVAGAVTALERIGSSLKTTGGAPCT
jgi:hypothetical protein